MNTEVIEQSSNTGQLADREPNPGQWITTALQQKVPPDQMRELFELQKAWEDRQEQRAYAAAIAGFQAECPIIEKNKSADRYDYAPLDFIYSKVKPLLAKYKITVQFSESDEIVNGEPGIKVFCRVRVGGYSEMYHAGPFPIPSNLKINDTQKRGWAITYARRYALCAALNIVVGNEDSDAQFQQQPPQQQPPQTRPPAQKPTTNGHKAPPMPKNGKELAEMLKQADANLVKSGQAITGELLVHIHRQAEVEGRNTQGMEHWKGQAIEWAVNVARKFAKSRPVKLSDEEMHDADTLVSNLINSGKFNRAKLYEYLSSLCERDVRTVKDIPRAYYDVAMNRMKELAEQK